MSNPVADPRRVLTNFASWDAALDPHLTQEWLVTNGMNTRLASREELHYVDRG
jgi:hypothetical protein